MLTHNCIAHSLKFLKRKENFIVNDKYIWSLLFADTHVANKSERMCEAFKNIYYSKCQIIFDVYYNYIAYLRAVKVFYGFALLERVLVQLWCNQFRQSSLVIKQNRSDLRRKPHKPPTAFEWVHFFGTFFVQAKKVHTIKTFCFFSPKRKTIP